MDDRKIEKVVISDHVLPDIDRDNNIWENKNAGSREVV